MLVDVICYCTMTSVMALDNIMLLYGNVGLKDVTNTSKHMLYSPTIGGNSSAQWLRVGRR